MEFHDTLAYKWDLYFAASPEFYLRALGMQLIDFHCTVNCRHDMTKHKAVD